MSKKIAFTAAAGALVALASTCAHAYDGTITISGKVTSTTCTINAGNKDVTVLLPTVSASALPAKGTIAGATPFTISLTNCSPVQGAGTAYAYFDNPTNVDAKTGNLMNGDTSANGASNVQVALLNADLSPISLQKSAGSQGQTPVSISSGNADLNYVAQYVATGVVGAGNVQTYTTYSIAYQ